MMKESEIEWIGEIPEKWGVVLLSSLFSHHKSKNVGLQETNLLSLSYGRIVRKDITTSEGLLPESFETYNIVDVDDIVFRLTDLQNDKRSLRTGLCKEKGIITSAYTVIRPTTSSTDSRYLQYLYHAYDICKVFYGLGDGVRQGMGFDDLKKIPTLVPALEEQKKIADFLDGKCAEIDELVQTEEKMIEELKAYKQSVITEAVTKGLDPAAPMKDSGIEWIGEIPESWNIRKIKRLFNVYSGATPKSDEDSYWDGDIAWVTPADFKTEDVFIYKGRKNITEEGLKSCTTRLVPPNSIIFSKRAPVGAVAININELCTNQGCLACIPQKHIVTKFYYYAMSVLQREFEEAAAGTTFKEISYTAFANFELPFAVEHEQNKIADYLDEKCAKIDEIIALRTEQINQLKEYKKSLIYEYVTGKKEVV